MQSFMSQSLYNTYFYELRGRQTQGPPRAAHTLATPLHWCLAHTLYDLAGVDMIFFDLGPRALEMLRAPRYLNPAMVTGGPVFTLSLPGGRLTPSLPSVTPLRISPTHGPHW